MKRFKFLSVVIALILVISAVGCATTGNPNEYPDRDRVYVEDPYRGTVVLERDPVTGRYYEVDSYGGGYYRNGNIYRGNRYYGRTRVYNDRNYHNQNTQQQPSQEQRRQYEQNRNDARGRVLGNRG